MEDPGCWLAVIVFFLLVTAVGVLDLLVFIGKISPGTVGL